MVDDDDQGVTVLNMPNTKPLPTHLAVRNPTKQMLARIDRLTTRLAKPGIKLNRSDVVRAILLRGLDAMEEDLKTAADE